MWNLSCLDWKDRLRNGKPIIPSLPLNKGEADRAAQIFDMLCLPDVPGTPAMADAAGDWFRDIVRATFGCMNDAERMIREYFILVAKKNSKTTGGAAIMVTALLMNERNRAEFLLIAPTKEVAELSFSQAAGMILQDPEGVLQKRFHIRDHKKEIVDRRTRAILKVKAFDTKVLTGVKPVGVLVDELHEISKNSAADKVIGQIRGGLLPNPEGFLMFITTQSDEPPRGVFKTELDRARKIRDGVAQGRMLPVLYEFPEEFMEGERGHEPWRDPKNWWMVTPNNGRSITVDRLIEDFETAKLAGEQEVIRWASQHLNLEVGLNLRSDRWAGADHWVAASDPGLTLNEVLKRSEVVTVGIDGGGLDDLFGLCVLGRERGTRRWLCWTKSWAFRNVLNIRKSEASRMTGFEADGDLTFYDTPGQDIDEIVSIIMETEEAGLLGQVGLDPVGIGQVIDALADVGIEGDDRVLAVSQGYRLMGAIKTVERKLVDKSFVHGGSRMMAWCVGNARCEPRGNAMMVTKAVSGVGKIDPLMAVFDAVALMSLNPDSGGSVYEDLAAERAGNAQSEAEHGPSESEEQQILADPAHPMWQQVREKYERRLERAFSSDWSDV
ncbi:MAG: terminase large subunit [Sterolibacterium sp.]